MVAVGIIILFVGFGAAVLVRKLLRRTLQELGIHKIGEQRKWSINPEAAISSFAAYAIYIVTIMLFLDYFKIKSIVFWSFAGGIALLLALMFFAGLKDIIPNVRGGLMLRSDKKGIVGKNIELKEVSGVVEHIGYLETRIRTKQGDVLLVPNALFLNKKM